jgi:hypothetical protein
MPACPNDRQSAHGASGPQRCIRGRVNYHCLWLSEEGFEPTPVTRHQIKADKMQMRTWYEILHNLSRPA